MLFPTDAEAALDGRERGTGQWLGRSRQGVGGQVGVVGQPAWGGGVPWT